MIQQSSTIFQSRVHCTKGWACMRLAALLKGGGHFLNQANYTSYGLTVSGLLVARFMNSLIPRLSVQLLFYYVRKKSWTESLGTRLVYEHSSTTSCSLKCRGYIHFTSVHFSTWQSFKTQRPSSGQKGQGRFRSTWRGRGYTLL